MYIKRFLLLAAVITASIISGCASTRSPIPLQGDTEMAKSLAGQWKGDYYSLGTRRYGDINFYLEANADTAYGDVMMYPRGWTEAEYREEDYPANWDAPIKLTVRFVQLDGGWLMGVLDSYRDPECGCKLETNFTGQMKGDNIEGVFTSHGMESHVTQSGTWRVKRTIEEAPVGTVKKIN